MKNSLLTIAGAVACSIPLTAAAQQAAPAAATMAGAADAASLAKLREGVRTDRKATVAHNFPRTEAEAFWPVYDNCHESIESAQRKTNRAIVDYVSAESQTTDAYSKQIVRAVLEAEADRARARKACFDRAVLVPLRDQHRAGGALRTVRRPGVPSGTRDDASSARVPRPGRMLGP